MNKRYWVEIPIIRSNYNKTKSAKFKGNLSFVSNQHGIIYDWKIEFNKLEIDLFSTKSIFIKKDWRYFRRKKLFNQLGFNQQIRPNKNSYNLIKLNNKQLEIVNKYFNNRKQYNSTLKNILGIIKGNNPCGEATNPKRAELVIDSNDNRKINKIKNFVILVDDLTMKKREDFHANRINAEEISFEKFVTLNKVLEDAFIFMQKEKNYDSWKTYLKNIKEYYQKYNNFIFKAKNIALRARNQFNKIVEKNILNDILPFGFKSSNEFQKCHIYEYHDLKDEIIQALRNKKQYKKYVNMIKDYNNFIPFPEEVHRKFDQHFFTYNIDNGKIIILKKVEKDFIEKHVINKYKLIPKIFLNDKRKKYFVLRNKKNNTKYFY